MPGAGYACALFWQVIENKVKMICAVSLAEVAGGS
jgi:hypothetical protein